MTNTQTRIPCASAAFGGVATTLFALGAELTRGQRLPNASYALGLAIFATLGACVAFFFGETNCRKAFFLGLGLPSLIQVGAASATHSAGASAASLFDLMPAARADGPAGGVTGRTLKIRLDAREVPGYDVIFVAADCKREERLSVEGAPAEKTVAVPAFSTRFAVQVGTARSASLPLSSDPGSTTIVKADIHSDGWSGLKRSLGVQQAAYTVALQLQTR